MMYGYDMGAGWLIMLVFWAFVIALFVWLALALSRARVPRDDSGSAGALRILEERLARGEIDPEEFRIRRDAIAGARS